MYPKSWLADSRATNCVGYSFTHFRTELKRTLFFKEKFKPTCAMFNLFLTERHTLFLYVPLLTLSHAWLFLPGRGMVSHNALEKACIFQPIQRESPKGAGHCVLLFYVHWLVKSRKAKIDQSGQNLKTYTNFFHLSKNLDTA